MKITNDKSRAKLQRKLNTTIQVIMLIGLYICFAQHESDYVNLSTSIINAIKLSTIVLSTYVAITFFLYFIKAFK